MLSDAGGGKRVKRYLYEAIKDGVVVDDVWDIAVATKIPDEDKAVYGGGSIKKIGLYEKITSQLAENGFTLYELSGVEPNPRISSVRKGVEICKEKNIDVVLAVGGGSTLDCVGFQIGKFDFRLIFECFNKIFSVN